MGGVSVGARRGRKSAWEGVIENGYGYIFAFDEAGSFHLDLSLHRRHSFITDQRSVSLSLLRTKIIDLKDG